MFVKLTHSTLRRRVAALFGTAAIAGMGLAGGMAGSAQAAEGCENATTPVGQLTREEAEAAALCLVNQERAANGVAPLAQSEALRGAAEGHAEASAQIKWWGPGIDPHTNPATGSTPSSRIAAGGYCPNPISYSYGENAYDGYSTGEGAQAPTAQDAVTWWMNSPGHRANILNPGYTETGLGIVAESPEKAPADAGGTFVQDFGSCTN
jgi:uncharacterized protein YkwD